MKDLLTIIQSYWTSILLLGLSAIPASYMHCHDHGKLKGWGKPWGYFGWNQQVRKYKWQGDTVTDQPAFWGSTTIFVTVTDFYHTCQALMRFLMSLSITMAIVAPWWYAGGIWLIYATIHAIFYKLLSR